MAGPLTKKDVSDLKEAVYLCRQAKNDIDKVDACGIDCQERREKCELMTKVASDLLTHFGQKQSPPNS